MASGQNLAAAFTLGIAMMGMTTQLTPVDTGDGLRIDVPQPSLLFRAPKMKDGTPTIYRFMGQTDDGVVRLLVDAEGHYEGAVPGAWAEIAVRAQDEIHDPAGKVLASSDVFGRIIGTSSSFGYTTDPKQGNCRGRICPETLHVVGDRNLRLAADGTLDVVVGDRQALVIGRESVSLPFLKAARPDARVPICADASGTLSVCDDPALRVVSATSETSGGEVLRLRSMAAGPPGRDLFRVQADGSVHIPTLAAPPGSATLLCADDTGLVSTSLGTCDAVIQAAVNGAVTTALRRGAVYLAIGGVILAAILRAVRNRRMASAA